MDKNKATALYTDTLNRQLQAGVGLRAAIASGAEAHVVSMYRRRLDRLNDLACGLKGLANDSHRRGGQR